MVRAILLGWPGWIRKCRSIFLGHSHWSLTDWFGIIKSIDPRPQWSISIPLGLVLLFTLFPAQFDDFFLSYMPSVGYL